MKLTLKIILIATLLLTLSGACMSISLNPFKQEVVLMSPLKGTLFKSGKPLANADIKVKIVIIGGRELINHYKTDENGVFDLPIQKDVQTLSPLAEVAYNQHVSVILGGEEIRFWYAGKGNEKLFGELWTPGEMIGLTCDIDDEENRSARDEGMILTKCKWKEIRRI